MPTLWLEVTPTIARTGECTALCTQYSAVTYAQIDPWLSKQAATSMPELLCRFKHLTSLPIGMLALCGCTRPQGAGCQCMCCLNPV